MIEIPISVGELIDKLSILQVKKQKLKNEDKLKIVENEFSQLKRLSEKFLENDVISKTFEELVDTNSKLWDIEDKLRILEKEKRFGGEFVDLARKVYITNDKRFELKNNINILTSSQIHEVKEYVNYSE
jgi:hypothetical protein